MLGTEHPGTLSMNNLAFTWKGQDRHIVTLTLIENCVQARQQVLEPDHPQTDLCWRF